MKTFKVCVIIFWSILIFIIFSAAIKGEIVYKDQQLKRVVSTVFPEGWAFFTKNPREQIYLCYKSINGKYIPVTIKNFSKENVWGLSRKARMIGYETSMLLQLIAEQKNWQKAKGNFNPFFQPIIANPVVMEKKLNYFEKGRYIFVRFDHIPWAWNGKQQEKFRPFEYLQIDLTYKI